LVRGGCREEEEYAKMVEEELRRLKGAANREVEKRREQEKSSVEIEELNKQLGQLKLKIANKKEKLKAARKEIAILNQREKERLVDEDASYYATPDFNKLGMDELLRLEEHYLSSLRVVGVAKVCTPPRTRTAALHRYSILYLLT
jgi:outer membrane murein-binding lipoprotein Lpp